MPLTADLPPGHCRLGQSCFWRVWMEFERVLCCDTGWKWERSLFGTSVTRLRFFCWKNCLPSHTAGGALKAAGYVRLKWRKQHKKSWAVTLTLTEDPHRSFSMRNVMARADKAWFLLLSRWRLALESLHIEQALQNIENCEGNLQSTECFWQTLPNITCESLEVSFQLNVIYDALIMCSFNERAPLCLSSFILLKCSNLLN